jgi:dTDP-4-dehydrorhamnose reductase
MNSTSNIKNPKSILVTGKNGQLGQSLQKLVIQNSALKIQHSFTFVGRDQLELADSKSVERFFVNNEYDVIINCAAYTAVDKAESEPGLADQINHLAVKQLAEIAKQQEAMLIHVSTDYVFNGQNYKPYIESDPTDPQSVYGSTKLRGEQAIQAINPKGCIIRTSWVYSEYGNNFVKTMQRLGSERDLLNVIFDQVGAPTYAGDLAEAILRIVSSEQFVVSRDEANGSLPTTDYPLPTKNEIFHFSNEGVCSWYDFAKAIFEFSNIDCNVSPIETKDYPTPAKRPNYSLLNKAKIKEGFELTIPYWKDSLKCCIQRLQDKV